MYLWRKVLLFSFNLLRQRHDISVLLFIVHGHALWRGRMSEFGPIRNHYHVHLVDHSARAGCSTFCCATPCWREPTSSKQLSTVAAFCWFSVWSLSCRCRVKFSTQSSLAEIWVIKITFVLAMFIQSGLCLQAPHHYKYYHYSFFFYNKHSFSSRER